MKNLNFSSSVLILCGRIPRILLQRRLKKAWGDWTESIKENIVDSCNPFGPGKEVTKTDVKNLPHGPSVAVGYAIINAKDMDETVEIAQSAPIITSVRVYEAMSM